VPCVYLFHHPGGQFKCRSSAYLISNYSLLTSQRDVSPTIGWSQRVAVRANQADVAKQVVLAISIDVIEFKRHGLSLPLGASTSTADGWQDAFTDQATPKLVAMVGRTPDEEKRKRCLRYMWVVTAAKMATPGPVLGGEPVHFDDPADVFIVPARHPQPQSAEHTSET
jgi:hypothetical protein